MIKVGLDNLVSLLDKPLQLYGIKRNTPKQIFGFWDSLKKIRMRLPRKKRLLMLNKDNKRAKQDLLLRGISMMYLPNYHRTDYCVYIREHIFVFEMSHQCSMLPWGIVHHKNGIRTDNRQENLEGMIISFHMKLHHLD